MAGSKHPIFAEFIEDLRELWGQKLPEHDHWEKVQARLGILIKDESLQAACRDWPGKRGEELILYHDPDHGFFIGGLVRPREHLARPHDHAHTWTAYGVLDGTEKTTLYARTDAAALQARQPWKSRRNTMLRPVTSMWCRRGRSTRKPITASALSR